MPEPLNDRQREMLAYLCQFLREHGYQPSYDDFRRRFGLRSPNAVRQNILPLIAKGWIKPLGNGRKFLARAIGILFWPDGTRFVGLQAVPDDEPRVEFAETVFGSFPLGDSPC